MKTKSSALIFTISLAMLFCSCYPNSPNPRANSTPTPSKSQNLVIGATPTPSPLPKQIASSTAVVSQLIRESKFICDDSYGIPTTMARTARGSIPIILWKSQHFSASGYTPEVRCQEISARFQHYHEQGKLRYISTSKMNGYPILCVADRMLGSCLETYQGKAILLTLKPEDNVEQTLQELLVIRDTASSPMTQFIAKDFHGESMMQFTAKDLQGNMFVDLEKYITALIKEGKIDTSELEIDRINTNWGAD